MTKKKGLGFKSPIDLSEVRNEVAPVQEKKNDGTVAPTKKFTTFTLGVDDGVKIKTILAMQKLNIGTYLNSLIEDFLNEKVDENTDLRNRWSAKNDTTPKEETRRIGFEIDNSKYEAFKVKLRYYNITQREFFTPHIKSYIDRYYNEALSKLKKL